MSIMSPSSLRRPSDGALAWWHRHPLLSTVLLPFALLFTFCVTFFLFLWWLLGLLSTARLWVFTAFSALLVTVLVVVGRLAEVGTWSPTLAFRQSPFEYSLSGSLLDVIGLLFAQMLILNLLHYTTSVSCAIPTAVFFAVSNCLFVVLKAMMYCWGGVCSQDEYLPTTTACLVLIVSFLVGVLNSTIVSRIWRPVHLQSLEDAEASLFLSAVGPRSPITLEKHVIAGHRTHFVHNSEMSPNLPVMVMLHGFGGGGALWYQNFPRLSQHFRVITVDWLGCGGSERPEFRAKTEKEATAFFVDALHDWRQAMIRKEFLKDSEPITFCGHSLGAYLCARYVLRYSDQTNVDHLILVSPVGVIDPPPAERQRSGYIWRVFGWLWDLDFTPQAMLRFMGPFGPRIAAAIVLREFGKYHLHQAVPWKDLSWYMYQISALDGSGEFGLSALLLPGAWAKVPFGPLLERATKDGQIKFPVTFVFGGGHDWTRIQDGKAVVRELNDIYQRITPGAAPPPPTTSSARPVTDPLSPLKIGAMSAVSHSPHLCLQVANTGHNLFMENPLEFSAKLIAASARHGHCEADASLNRR